MTSTRMHYLAIHGPEARFQQFIEAADTQGGHDGAGQFADSSRHDDHKRIDDIVLPQPRLDIANQASSAHPATPAKPDPKANV